MKRTRSTDSQQRTRQVIGVCVLIPLLALLVWIVWLTYRFMNRFEVTDLPQPHTVREYLDVSAIKVQAFADYLDQFGSYSWIVMILIEMLQIVVAVVPGGVTETAAGFLFGPVGGLLLSWSAIFLAYSLVFFLVKKFGIKLVALFVDPKKIDELKFINSASRLKRTVFILYLIPALPKDAFTYFFGLTRIRWRDFILLSLIARTPTLFATICFGWQLSVGEFWIAATIIVSIFVCSLLGILWYSRYSKRKAGVQE
ncbi:MAG: TVP38/TMEM64 family protein [Clostridia bacterium]|nr:TVP38/TMEM64 family protein [Clostridia bacterium]